MVLDVVLFTSLFTAVPCHIFSEIQHLKLPDLRTFKLYHFYIRLWSWGHRIL